MGTIVPFVPNGVFYPEDVEAMSLAYESVCRALHINGDAGARETIAVRVIQLAQRGELCPTVLRDRVLAEANAGTERYFDLASLFLAGRSPRRTSSRTAAAPLGPQLAD